MAVRKGKVRDWKLVLADIRRTEGDVSDLQEKMAEFHETLIVMKRRLVFIRACIEKRTREKP
jgi:cell division septal protein FtsQ